MDFSKIVGKTFIKIYQNQKRDELRFVDDVGTVFLMYHVQDCCESVNIESIVGDLSDLYYTPILLAEVVSNKDSINPDVEGGESFTWTFYKLATIKGYVDIRWVGCSNGYYSEEVSFTETNEQDADYAAYTTQIKNWIDRK